MSTKICRDCCQELPLSAFSTRKLNCKPCYNEAAKRKFEAELDAPSKPEKPGWPLPPEPPLWVKLLHLQLAKAWDAEPEYGAPRARIQLEIAA